MRQITLFSLFKTFVVFLFFFPIPLDEDSFPEVYFSCYLRPEHLSIGDGCEDRLRKGWRRRKALWEESRRMEKHVLLDGTGEDSY